MNVGTVPSTRPGYCCYKSSGASGTSIAFSKDSYADLTAFLNYLKAQYNAGNPVQVIAKLATPVTYELTAPQVKTLLGINNLWADAGDILLVMSIGKSQTKSPLLNV